MNFKFVQTQIVLKSLSNIGKVTIVLAKPANVRLQDNRVSQNHLGIYKS